MEPIVMVEADAWVAWIEADPYQVHESSPLASRIEPAAPKAAWECL